MSGVWFPDTNPFWPLVLPVLLVTVVVPVVAGCGASVACCTCVEPFNTSAADAAPAPKNNTPPETAAPVNARRTH